MIYLAGQKVISIPLLDLVFMDFTISRAIHG
jgi:hypothetical protein